MSFALPIPLPELLRRTFKESIDDDCLGLSAQLSYYFFLALFPAILVLLAAASFFPLTELTDDITGVLGPFVSAEVLTIIQEQMRRLAEADSGGLLTFGLLGALWSSSAALVSIVGALNKAYDIDEGRPWWQVRLTALMLTIVVALIVVVALTLVLVGPAFAHFLGERTRLGQSVEWTWLVLQWPIAFAMVSTAIGLMYYFGPDADQDWVWITPGAVVATVLWLVASLGFKAYIAYFTHYNESYGAVGSVIVLLLWFQVTGLAILVGGELNAEIEHASPHGKGPGEKTPTGRKLIGRRAAHAFNERLKRLGLWTRPATPVVRPSGPAGSLGTNTSAVPPSRPET